MTSFKSSSLCFLSCLCITGWASTQSLPNNVTFPFYDVANTVCLNSNCNVNNLFGAQFDSSFLGATTSFSLLGNGYQLSFSNCQAPVQDDTALISSSGSLSLSNLSKLVISNNISTGSEGLISGSTTSINNCSYLIFTNNRTSYSPVVSTTGAGGDSTEGTTTTVNCCCGSVLKTEQKLSITNINKKITFENNSGNFGSAILNKTDATCDINKNFCPITFSQNYATCGGGAIYDGSVTFEGNTRSITFSGNTAANGLATVTPQPSVVIAAGSGGAICCPTKSVTFNNNTNPITFSYNSAAKDGGAIYTTTCTLNTNSDFFFIKNSATENGGAICARSLTMKTIGDTNFYHNRAQQGGAIYISSSVGDTTSTADSSLTLTAGRGIMTFAGNTINTRPGVRNAIQLDGDAKITSISASGDAKIIFYDPITNTNPGTTAGDTGAGTTPNEIIINTTGYSGSVVFSSALLSLSEQFHPENSLSSLCGKVVIQDGQLVVTDNATLNVLGLTADPGRLTLGSGADIGLLTSSGTPPTTTLPTATDFSIKNLGCDVTSYLSPTWETATVNSGAQTITLEGQLAVVCEDPETTYDNSLLASSLTIPFATFTSNNNNNPTATSFTTGEIPVPDHYGYQGSWESSWSAPLLSPTPNGGVPSGTDNRTLYLIWNPSPSPYASYILAPERRGELVPNSLWSSFFAAQIFANSLLGDHIQGEHEGWGSSIKALGAYSHQRPRSQYDGFSGRHGGYQTNIRIYYPDQAALGIAFGQLYGQIKSKLYQAKSSEQMVFFGLFGNLPVATPNREIHFAWESAYVYAKNHMTTNYSRSYLQTPLQSQATWYNNVYYVSVSVNHPFLLWFDITQILAEQFHLTGFISAECFGGWQSAFQESGSLARKFSRGKGHNLSLPVGFVSTWYTPFKRAPSTLMLKFAYKPDVYRTNPHTNMTIITNSETFTIRGIPLTRNGVLLQLHDDIQFSQRITGYIDYVYNSKQASINHRIITGIQSIF